MPLTNLNRVVGIIQRIPKNLRGETASAMLAEFKDVELPEVIRSTPKDTGALIGTEHVEGPFFLGNVIKVMIVAGGDGAPYALIVHEDLEAHHPIGDAKYIERPLRESAPYISARIARRINARNLIR